MPRIPVVRLGEGRRTDSGDRRMGVTANRGDAHSNVCIRLKNTCESDAIDVFIPALELAMFWMPH